MKPPVELPAKFLSHPELAAVVLFALALDARASGNDRLRRATEYRLSRLGWSVRPIEPSEGTVDQ